jgi:hypothetical protein
MGRSWPATSHLCVSFAWQWEQMPKRGKELVPKGPYTPGGGVGGGIGHASILVDGPDKNSIRGILVMRGVGQEERLNKTYS